MKRSTVLLRGLAALAVLALLAACGDDAPPEEAVDLDTKPGITVPDGDPPTSLVVRDLVEGEGDEARAGMLVSVHYVGVAWSTGEQFDASWDRGQAFTFQLGAGMVIEGWDEGVEGMRVGGRRELTIPPDMAYGQEGRPGIQPNETLVFVVDLLDVEAT